MKYVFFIMIVLTMSCSSKIVFINERANPIRLEQTVKFLADTIGGRSYKQIEALQKASEYIQLQFNNIGLKSEIQNYKWIDKKHENIEYSYENVFCEIKGETDSLFIVGAHYDTYDNFPGADDNASGVAGLIETARIVYNNPRKPYYSLIFVAFTLEEPPFFRSSYMGSYQFANLIKNSNRYVAGMVSIEMIGCFTDKKEQKYPYSIFKLFYPSRGNFIAVISNFSSSSLADKYQNHAEVLNEIHCVQFMAPASFPGVDYSDHLNFWRFGYKAFMITNTAMLRNFNYHTANDKSDYLDYKRMGFVVNALANMLLSKF